MPVYIPKGRKNYSYEFCIGGVRFRKGTGQANREAAKRIEGKARTEAALSLAFPAPKRAPMTLNTAAERYYQEVAERQPSARTTDDQLAVLLDRLGGGTRLDHVTGDRLSRFVAGRRAEIADASVNREIELLRRVFRRARKVWKVAIGDMPDWSQLRLVEPEPRKRELTLDEERDLFESLRPDFHGLIRFAMLTGVRLAPIITMTWRQVELAQGRILFKVKSRHPGGRTLEIPVTRAIAAVLAGERGRHPIFVFTYVCRKSRARRRKGERYPFTKNGWRKAWKAALAAAAIEDFRFHDLRHTAASRTLRACGNLKLVKDMLGHASITSTDRYAHVLNEDVRLAMEAAQHHLYPTTAGGEKGKALNENGN